MFMCQTTQDSLAHCLRLLSFVFTTEKLLRKICLYWARKKQMTNEQHSVWNQPKQREMRSLTFSKLESYLVSDWP